MAKSPWVGKTVMMKHGMALLGGLRGKVLRASSSTDTLSVQLLEGRGAYHVEDLVHVHTYEVELLQQELQI